MATGVWWNRVVPDNDERRAPLHFGDYPDGAYWSAERLPKAAEDEPADHTVSGVEIRFMWDFGVRVPLWDDDGLLPEDPAWLRTALGLSDPLIDDLTRWGTDMDALDAAPSRRTTEAYDALDVRARELAERLRQELGPRLSVTYKPW